MPEKALSEGFTLHKEFSFRPQNFITSKNTDFYCRNLFNKVQTILKSMSYLCIGIKVFQLRQSWPSFVSNAHILFNLFFLIRQWLEAIYLLLLVVTSQCNFFALFQQGPKKRSGRSFLKSSNTQNFLVFLGFFFSQLLCWSICD